VYHCYKKSNFWLCRYCYINKKAGGEYLAGSASAAAVHLAKRVKGNSVNASGPVTARTDPN
jgi:hypothetical protein